MCKKLNIINLGIAHCHAESVKHKSPLTAMLQIPKNVVRYIEMIIIEMVFEIEFNCSKKSSFHKSESSLQSTNPIGLYSRFRIEHFRDEPNKTFMKLRASEILLPVYS